MTKHNRMGLSHHGTHQDALPVKKSRSTLSKLLADKRAVFSGIVILVLVFLATFASMLPLQAPNEMALLNQLAKPSREHWLGTDSFGRDILSRVVFGARVSLMVGSLTVLVAMTFGTTCGLISAFYGGVVDSFIMRIMDALLAFPSILLAITLMGILGPGKINVVLGLGIVYTPTFARIARAKTLSVTSSEYVSAARTIGASDLRLLGVHIVPNMLGPVAVQAAVAFAFAIIAEAGLSFLGLGVPPDVPSWGAMLTEARRFIETDPWFAVIPGACLSITVLSITLLGDSIRQLLDPSSI
ncbi:MAG: ABC transporter permease [Thermomicrobiales bacterium]|nr:ABC transporter permease [Thermomicrobiales bacterium]MCO5225930.1 ABC transporter permease [Thermomicrobiales bacterium]MCO5227707.1 ABC transporter permease [Thermomicrobiales bacterium]